MRHVAMVDLRDAQAVANVALTSAAADGGKPVAVAVADREGNLVTLQRMDGTPAASVLIAANKAYTAARLGRSTAALAEQLQADKTQLAAFGDPRFTSLAGGHPITSTAGEVLGGLGVSGRRAHEDQALAEQAAQAHSADG